MRTLASFSWIPFVSLMACQHADSGAAAASDGGAGATSSAATASPGAAGGSFASGFEGAITMHVTTSRGAEDLTFFTKAGKLRVDTPAHNNEMAHVVFDPSTNKTLVIMDNQKMYMEMDRPPVGGIPPGMPGGGPGAAATPHAPPQITKTGKHETIAGMDCEDWTSKDASGKVGAICAAKGIAFFDFAAMAPGRSEGAAWIDQLRSEQYFPLRAVDTDASGKEVSRMEATKIERKSLDDSLFVPPAGYHPMVIPQMGGAGGMPPGMPTNFQMPQIPRH
jgi:hypothetical protein